MNRLAIDRALQKYAVHKDPLVQQSVGRAGPILRAAAELAHSLGDADLRSSEPTNKEIDDVIRGGEPLLSRGLLTIEGDSLVKSLTKMGEIVAKQLLVTDAVKDKAKNFDWAPYATKLLAMTASRRPDDYYEECGKILEASKHLEGLTKEEAQEFSDDFFLFTLWITVRAYLDSWAEQCARLFDMREQAVVNFERRRTCPVCGSHAAMAYVEPTTRGGNAKKLFCTDCGCSWKFERIRCPECGNEAVSDFTYVHDHDDESHRLHVDKHCGTAFPTYFAKGEELDFAPDVESLVVFPALEAAYAQGHNTES